jgi:hypothetical protein
MARKNKPRSVAIVAPASVSVDRYDSTQRPVGVIATHGRRSLALGLGVFVGVLVVASLRKD